MQKRYWKGAQKLKEQKEIKELTTKKRVMTDTEKQSVKDFINGLSEEELQVAVSQIDTELLHNELMKRALENERKLQNVKELIVTYEK